MMISPCPREFVTARRLATSAIAWIAVALWSCLPVRAVERVVRVLDQNDGLPASHVRAIAQTSDGFLWFSTEAGIVRYDGRHLEPWTRRPPVPRRSGGLIASPVTNELLFLDRRDVLSEVHQGRLVTLRTGVEDAAFARDGTLWLVRGGSLHRRDGAGAWSEYPLALPDPARVSVLQPGPRDEIYIATEEDLWRVLPGKPPSRVARIRGARQMLVLPGERIVMTTWEHGDSPRPVARVVEINGTGISILVTIPGSHPLGLAIRGDTIWMGTGNALVALRSGREPEILRVDQGIPGGGPLLVDHEESLWVGTFAGLYHFPEPETVIYGIPDGFRSDTLRNVQRMGDTLFVSSWLGVILMEPEAGSYHVKEILERTNIHGCIDGSGNYWTWLPGTVVRWNSGRTIPVPGIGEEPRGCAPRPDGTLWMLNQQGLFKTGPGETPRAYPGPREPDGDDWAEPLLEDSLGRLWLSRGDFICRAIAEEVITNPDPGWSCERAGRELEITSLAEISPGSIWMSTRGNGILRQAEGGWEPLPATEQMRASWVSILSPSPLGGVWVMMPGEDILRVRERRDLPDGWEVLERISSWNGLPGVQATHILEDEDGTLWVATVVGLVQVPPAARRAGSVPPRVEVAEVALDGERLSPSDPIELPYRRNRLALSFAAISYRGPGWLRYQMRMHPDEEWSEIGEPEFRLVDLPPGSYQPEVRASLDGTRWTPSPASVSFVVLRPWYLQWWALTLLGIAVAGLAVAAHRIRMQFALRLERQRSRIAMDLHDEMGSGLGSIGVLADLASGSGVSDDEKQEISRRIADTAAELGSSLTDIVWSLRDGSTTLESLAEELAKRGRGLFPGRTPALQTVFPERWPSVRLSLPVRRNLQLIGVEALHNAARHSGATHVTVGLARTGRRWRLWIEDDGAGLPAPALAGNGSGQGLDNMRRRAEQIRAAISWSAGRAGGTLVSVEFDPAAQDIRLA